MVLWIQSVKGRSDAHGGGSLFMLWWLYRGSGWDDNMKPYSPDDGSFTPDKAALQGANWPVSPDGPWPPWGKIRRRWFLGGSPQVATRWYWKLSWVVHLNSAGHGGWNLVGSNLSMEKAPRAGNLEGKQTCCSLDHGSVTESWGCSGTISAFSDCRPDRDQSTFLTGSGNNGTDGVLECNVDLPGSVVPPWGINKERDMYGCHTRGCSTADSRSGSVGNKLTLRSCSKGPLEPLEPPLGLNRLQDNIVSDYGCGLEFSGLGNREPDQDHGCRASLPKWGNGETGKKEKVNTWVSPSSLYQSSGGRKFLIALLLSSPLVETILCLVLMEDSSKVLVQQMEGLRFTEEELQVVDETKALGLEPVLGEERWLVGKLVSLMIVDGPLLIRIYFLVLLSPKDYDFHPFPIWLRIYDVPLGFMSSKVGEVVGNKFGTSIATDLRDENGCSGEYLRVRVEIDSSKPLKRCTVLGRNAKMGQPRVCMAKYERLPRFCFYCGIIDHEFQLCHVLPKGDTPIFQFGGWLRVEPPKSKDLAKRKLRPGIVYVSKDKASGSGQNLKGTILEAIGENDIEFGKEKNEIGTAKDAAEENGNSLSIGPNQSRQLNTPRPKPKNAKRSLKGKTEENCSKKAKKAKSMSCQKSDESAFVPGKLISDNVIVDNELFHYLKGSKNGPNKGVAIKLDMEKAYDRVEWNSKKEARRLKEVIMVYEASSGQKINVEKSSIYFSNGMSEQSKSDLKLILNMREDVVLGQYLGGSGGKKQDGGLQVLD
ncbi:hypothetical protein GQ457_12G016680 [Hibiscus cannabinus]